LSGQQLGNEPRTHQLISEAARAWRLLRDPRTPGALKLIPLLGLLYVIFPLDFIPDLFPGAGQLDDVAVILVALRVFLQLAGREEGGVKAGDAPDVGRAAVGGNQEGVVSASYRVREE
jgi:uncharacterized membrane protein YkvA (DUF1232 family)